MANQLSELNRLEALYRQDHKEEHLIAQFRLLDKDKNGTISISELMLALHAQMGDDSEMAAKFFMQLGDKNHDGVLSLQEFVDMSKQIMN